MVYYLRNLLTLWSNLQIKPNIPGVEPITLGQVDGSIGCLLVYESLEEFQKAWPGEIPVPLPVTSEKPDVTH